MCTLGVFTLGRQQLLPVFLEALWFLSWPPTLLEGFVDWLDWRSFLTWFGCNELLAQVDLAWWSLTFLKPEFPHIEQVAPFNLLNYSSVLKYVPEVVSVESVHLVQSSAPALAWTQGYYSLKDYKRLWSRSLGCQPVNLPAISPAPAVSPCRPLSFQSSEGTIPQQSTSLS